MPDQWNFVIAAYGVTWLGLIGYAAYVSRRLSRARRAAEGGDA